MLPDREYNIDGYEDDLDDEEEESDSNYLFDLPEFDDDHWGLELDAEEWEYLMFGSTEG